MTKILRLFLLLAASLFTLPILSADDNEPTFQIKTAVHCLFEVFEVRLVMFSQKMAWPSSLAAQTAIRMLRIKIAKPLSTLLMRGSAGLGLRDEGLKTRILLGMFKTLLQNDLG